MLFQDQSNIAQTDSTTDNLSTETESLKALVLSIIRGDSEYSDLIDFLDPAITSQSMLDSETALTLALLLGDVETQGDLNDQLYALSSDSGPPALAVSTSGRVLSINSASNALFGAVLGQSVMQYGIRKTDFTDFKKRIEADDAPSLLQIYPNRHQNTPLIFTGRYQESHKIFILRAIEVQWPQSIDKALKDIFELTTSECNILACLARGMTSEEISEQRNSKISTVRQQIKSLLQKIDVSSQVQAAAFGATIAAQTQTVSDLTSAKEIKKSHLELVTNEDIDQVVLSDDCAKNILIHNNRHIEWRRFGKKDGRPVLHMHSTYFGSGDHAAEREFAIAEGLDVVVIVRPGYGETQLPINGEPSLTTHITDCIAVIDKVGWQHTWITCHDYGLVYSLALAKQWTGRVNTILAISPLPLHFSDDGLQGMPIQQRPFIWAARHSFWMTRILVRLAQVKVRKLGPRSWMNMVFEGSPEELDIFQTSAGQDISVSSYHFNLRQHSTGILLDVKLGVADDWSALLAKTQVPLIGFTGQNNTTFNVKSVRKLSQINPKFELHEVEGAGLTLNLTHPEIIHKALLQLIK